MKHKYRLALGFDESLDSEGERQYGGIDYEEYTVAGDDLEFLKQKAREFAGDIGETGDKRVLVVIRIYNEDDEVIYELP